MIQNIVFDMGGVLLYYEPKPYVYREIPNQEEAKQIYEACFAGEEWRGLDAGLLTEEEALAGMEAHVPEGLRPALRQIFANWPACMSPVPGMEDLVEGLKRAGYRCWLLSNASRRFPVLQEAYPVFSKLDGIFVSAYYHMVKPSHEIYRRFLQEFSLSAAECVFLDDMEANVQGALECGLHAHRFTGREEAEAFLRAEGVAW